MNGIIEISLFLLCLITLAPILGNYFEKVFTGKKNLMSGLLLNIETRTYKLTGINSEDESNWKTYTFDLLLFNFIGLVVVFVLQQIQNFLPINPANQLNVSWHSALNTAVSFVTNTNWQGYAGETTMSYLTQMLALTVQNFVSAATGIAVLVALIKGISGKTTTNLGNFWVDLIRSTYYILLPLSVILAFALVTQGVIQNFSPYHIAHTLNGSEQLIPGGPAASQIAIKQLGTNGGGFFNANSAHPFENPTPFSNFLQVLSILLIPAALPFMFGKMTGNIKQGWTLFLTMLILFILGLALSLYSEYSTTIQGHALMEGKETRFGIVGSVLWSTVTTVASNGSVNAMHDSLSPLSGMVTMFNMMLGEIIFGGVGSGLYGMILFVILTVFIAGLMVGRTPEFMGKKIEAFEVQMSIIGILIPSFCILIFSAIATVSPVGLSGLNNKGPHGYSEILYAFTSASGNNGSAFAGLNTNTVFFNLSTAFCMLAGRFGVIIPVLAIAGSLAKKKITPVSEGTFRTDTSLFVGLLIGVILIVGGLTFFPALSLGPVVEHLLMNNGIVF
jgi:potassium-transporting ATPase potassium-binding subunit